MKCVIAANGDLSLTPLILSRIKGADKIIAADGGAVHLHRMNLVPDVIIGDLDSIDPETLEHFISNQVLIKTYPSRKDKTDTELCIDYALEQGCTEMTFLGMTGCRLDHTLANIFLLYRMADLSITAAVIDAHNEIYMVTSALTLDGAPGDLLSVIPVTPKVTGLTLEGLAYPLDNATLFMGTARGVSNYFKGTQAKIQIKSGIVLVTKSMD